MSSEMAARQESAMHRAAEGKSALNVMDSAANT